MKMVLEQGNSDDDGDIIETDVECSTLQEAADVAASDNRSVDVVILPPSTVDVVSDEKTGDGEDLSSSSLPSEVVGPLIVHFHNNKLTMQTRKKKQLRSRAAVSNQKQNVLLYPSGRNTLATKSLLITKNV